MGGMVRPHVSALDSRVNGLGLNACQGTLCFVLGQDIKLS